MTISFATTGQHVLHIHKTVHQVNSHIYEKRSSIQHAKANETTEGKPHGFCSLPVPVCLASCIKKNLHTSLQIPPSWCCPSRAVRGAAMTRPWHLQSDTLATEEESSHRRAGADCFSCAVVAQRLVVLPARVRPEPPWARRGTGRARPQVRGGGEKPLWRPRYSQQHGCCSRQAAERGVAAPSLAGPPPASGTGRAHPQNRPCPKHTGGEASAAHGAASSAGCCSRRARVPCRRGGLPVVAERAQPPARPSPSLKSVAEGGERRQAGSINPCACRSFATRNAVKVVY